MAKRSYKEQNSLLVPVFGRLCKQPFAPAFPTPIMESIDMKRLLYIVFVVLFAGTAIAQPKELSTKEIAAKGLKSVVFIKTKDARGKASGFGSGFFITNKLIATNYHVIEGATQVTAGSIYKTHEEFSCKVLGANKENDLAIVEIQGTTGIPLELSLQDLEIGERVYAIGNPEGLGGTFSEGLISSLRNFKGFTNSVIQHTAPMSQGSSGGPLLNSNGQVIGINSAINKTGQNINYAVDSSDLLVLMTEVEPEEEENSGNLSTILFDQLQKRIPTDRLQREKPKH
jgi:S1-C subfamily serine protease